MKAQRGSGDIFLLFNLGAKWGWVVNAMHVWTGAEDLALTEFDPRSVQPVVTRYTD